MNLQRVRIKVDPLWSEKLGIINSPYYEGYILQECPGSKMDFKVYIINTPAGVDPIQNVSGVHLQPVGDENKEETQEPTKINSSRLSKFKKHLMEKLQELGKDLESAEVIQVLKSNDIGFIETYLKQMGLTDDDLLNLYRQTLQK
jgi:hypothetical protein